MGFFTAISKVYLAVTNIIFLVIGLAIFAVGLVFRFGDEVTNKYVQSAVDSLKSAIDSSGVGNSTGIDIDMNLLLFQVSMACIGIGLFLAIVAFCAIFGALCKMNKLLVLYVLICTVVLIAEIVMVILLYLTDIIQGSVKDYLLQSISTGYVGFGGTDFTSVSWNILMILGGCCGLYGYNDFTSSWTWDKTADGNSAGLTTPIACCKELPSSSDLTCAESPTSANNNQDYGCYDHFWKLTLGNPPVMTGILGGLFVFQMLLIVTALVIVCTARNNERNKVSPMPAKPRHRRF